MDPEVLNSYLKREPFVPFKIEKTGGTWYEVKNPAMAFVSKRCIELGMPVENGQQRFISIALIHIASVEISLPLSRA